MNFPSRPKPTRPISPEIGKRLRRKGSVSDSLGSATRLQRTFLLQIEALQKLRGNGGQEIRVEHVNVSAGGQALVGNVTLAKGEG